jgi:hypothetical protein
VTDAGKPDDFITRAFKLRAKMIERGIRIGKTECACGGWIVGELAGRKDHLRANCASCGMAVMQ